MNIYKVITIVCFLISSIFAERPNIVIILADDMGFSDISPYGGEINTPNLQKLSQGGLRYTNFYNAGRCCPTRASLMTGLYPHQTGIGHMTQDLGYDGYRGDLNSNCMTIAEVLKNSGYSTYISGKWHLTKFFPPTKNKKNWPLQRGFMRFYGTIAGAGSYFDPWTLVSDNTEIPNGKEDYYYTDAITQNAIKFISEHKKNKPFFLLVSYTAPHWPLHALPEDIEKYKGKYSQGWDKLRQQRYKRILELGMLGNNTQLSKSDVTPWNKISKNSRVFWERRMEVYAAMVDRMDQGIGKIVDTLRKGKKFDNTLTFFLSDNGSCSREYGNDIATSKKTQGPKMNLQQIQRKMKPDYTRDGRNVRQGFNIICGDADTYVSHGRPWANFSNTPFRLYKTWVHEGGIASPLIVSWPKTIKKAGIRNQVCHVIDIAKTCFAVSGARYPKIFNGKKIQLLQGQDISHTFVRNTNNARKLFWEHQGNQAVRVGKWKLVSCGSGWELYDMENDRTEIHNLSKKFPKKVEEMSKIWWAWAKDNQVLPMVQNSKR